MNRAYGWTTTGQIVDDEAAVIRSAAADLIDGASINSIVNRLNDDQVPTSSGKPWSIVVLRRMLRNPRMTGRRDDDGTLVDNPNVDPILDVDTWDQVGAILTDGDRAKYAPGRRTTRLATGFFRCAVCGDKAYGRADRDSEALRTECGHAQISVHIAEQELAERVLARITTGPWLEKITAAVEAGTDEHRKMIAAATERMTVLAEVFGDGETDRAALEAGLASARAVKAEAESALAVAQALDVQAVTDVEIVTWWGVRATLGEQRALVGVVVDHVGILPLRDAVDGDRLQIQWR